MTWHTRHYSRIVIKVATDSMASCWCERLSAVFNVSKLSIRVQIPAVFLQMGFVRPGR